MSGDWLTDYLASINPTAPPWLAEQVTGRPAVRPEGDPFNGHLVPPMLADDLADVVKLSGIIQIADELLSDAPLNIPRPPLRWRLKMLAWDARHKAAWLAYRLIAGTTPEADYGGDE